MRSIAAARRARSWLARALRSREPVVERAAFHHPSRCRVTKGSQPGQNSLLLLLLLLLLASHRPCAESRLRDGVTEPTLAGAERGRRLTHLRRKVVARAVAALARSQLEQARAEVKRSARQHGGECDGRRRLLDDGRIAQRSGRASGQRRAAAPLAAPLAAPFAAPFAASRAAPLAAPLAAASGGHPVAARARAPPPPTITVPLRGGLLTRNRGQQSRDLSVHEPEHLEHAAFY